MLQANKAVAKRNDVIHALIWHPDASGELAYSILKRGKKGSAAWVQAAAPVNELTAIADDLYEAAKALAAFMVAHFGTNHFPTPYGDRTLYGPSVRAAIARERQHGTESEEIS